MIYFTFIATAFFQYTKGHLLDLVKQTICRSVWAKS